MLGDDTQRSTTFWSGHRKLMIGFAMVFLSTAAVFAACLGIDVFPIDPKTASIPLEPREVLLVAAVFVCGSIIVLRVNATPRRKDGGR